MAGIRSPIIGITFDSVSSDGTVVVIFDANQIRVRLHAGEDLKVGTLVAIRDDGMVYAVSPTCPNCGGQLERYSGPKAPHPIYCCYVKRCQAFYDGDLFPTYEKYYRGLETNRKEESTESAGICRFCGDSADCSTGTICRNCSGIEYGDG